MFKGFVQEARLMMGRVSINRMGFALMPEA